MKFTLRAYEPSDFEALSALDRECFPRGIAYTRRMLRSYLAHPGSYCLVADATVPHPARPSSIPLAGFIMAEAHEREAHIVTLDVAEAYRRAGAGTALLREMEQQLGARNVKRIALETATNNEAGFAFWQRHGYRVVGVIPRYYLDRLNAYYMVKELSAAAENSQAHGGSA